MTPEQLAIKCATIASSKNGEGLTILKIGAISNIADYFVICSGTSSRQLKTIVDEIELYAKSISLEPQIEGYQGAHWIVLDLGDVVVHVFTSEYRLYYSLEEIWKEAPRLETEEKRDKEPSIKNVIWSSKRKR